MRYTEKMHARRLYNMLKKEGDKSQMCPGSYNYSAKENLITGKWADDNVCMVCMNFVGIKYINQTLCPCPLLGETEAIARSLAALRERGFKC